MYDELKYKKYLVTLKKYFISGQKVSLSAWIYSLEEHMAENVQIFKTRKQKETDDMAVHITWHYLNQN